MKKIVRSAVLIMIGVSLFSSGLARSNPEDEHKMPNGCRQVGYAFKYKQLMLYPEKAGLALSVYFMYNKSEYPVRLYQTRGDEDAYFSHLVNTIQPGRWGALSVDDKFMKFICTKVESRSNYGRITDCQDLLQVCEWDNVLFGVNNRGNYWAVTSNSRSGAMRIINRTHGILLRK